MARACQWPLMTTNDRQEPKCASMQRLTHYTAGCFDCGASVSAKNAQAWAHQHVRKTGHRVELSLGWNVSPESTR